MDVLLTRADLQERGIKISRSTMLRMEAQGKFPKRRYLTPRLSRKFWAKAEYSAGNTCSIILASVP